MGQGVTRQVSNASALIPVTFVPAPPAFNLTRSSSSVTGPTWATSVRNFPVTLYDVYRSLYPTMTPVPISHCCKSPTATLPYQI